MRARLLPLIASLVFASSLPAAALTTAMATPGAERYRIVPSATVRSISDVTPSGFCAVSYRRHLDFYDRTGNSIGRWVASMDLAEDGYQRPVAIVSGPAAGQIAVGDDNGGVHFLNPQGRDGLVEANAFATVRGPGVTPKILPNGFVLVLDPRLDGGTLHVFGPTGGPSNSHLLSRLPARGASSAHLETLLLPNGLIVASYDAGPQRGRVVFINAAGQEVSSHSAEGRSLADSIVTAGSNVAVGWLTAGQRANVSIFDAAGTYRPDREINSEKSGGDFRIVGFADGSLALLFTRTGLIEFRRPNGAPARAAVMTGGEILAQSAAGGDRLFVAIRGGGVAVFDAAGAELARFPGVDGQKDFIPSQDGSMLAVGERSIARLRLSAGAGGRVEGVVESTWDAPPSLIWARRFAGEGDAFIAVRRDLPISGANAPAIDRSALIFFSFPLSRP